MTYILFGIVAITSFLIASAILLGLSKLFNVTNATYKRSMLVCIITSVSSSITAIIFALIGLGVLSQILAIVVAFFVFSYLFKRYYQVSWKKALGVYVLSIVLGIIISLITVIPIRLFVTEPFVVAGQSMNPTLLDGEYLFINKYDRQYERGDIIVFKLADRKIYLIQRIVALPSEKITIKDGVIKINENEFKSQTISGKIKGDIDVTLKADEFFVIGDNAEVSVVDSRQIGPIKEVNIVGKVFFK